MAEDDRVVLPLSRVRFAAHVLCGTYCPAWREAMGQEHTPTCLIPLLSIRDRLAAQTANPEITPDCRDGKHAACTGCPCTTCPPTHNRKAP